MKCSGRAIGTSRSWDRHQAQESQDHGWELEQRSGTAIGQNPGGLTKETNHHLVRLEGEAFQLGENKLGSLEMVNVNNCIANIPAPALVIEESDVEVTCNNK